MKGEKTGGRQRGTPNLRQSRGGLVAQACDEVGVNPFVVMAQLAKDGKTEEIRGRNAAELAGYMQPKLRAIEHTGAGGGPIEANISARDFILSAIAETDAGSEAPGGNQPSDGTAG
jgi:hypothetical protein